MEEIYEKHLKKEPKVKFDPKFKKLGIKFETHSNRIWKFELDKITDVLSLEHATRVLLLKEIKKGGITIGEVAKKFDLPSSIVGDVLYYNIKKIHILNEVSIWLNINVQIVNQNQWKNKFIQNVDVIIVIMLNIIPIKKGG